MEEVERNVPDAQDARARSQAPVRFRLGVDPTVPAATVSGTPSVDDGDEFGALSEVEEDAAAPRFSAGPTELPNFAELYGQSPQAQTPAFDEPYIEDSLIEDPLIDDTVAIHSSLERLLQAAESATAQALAPIQEPAPAQESAPVQGLASIQAESVAGPVLAADAGPLPTLAPLRDKPPASIDVPAPLDVSAQLHAQSEVSQPALAEPIGLKVERTMLSTANASEPPSASAVPPTPIDVQAPRQIEDHVQASFEAHAQPSMALAEEVVLELPGPRSDADSGGKAAMTPANSSTELPPFDLALGVQRSPQTPSDSTPATVKPNMFATILSRLPFMKTKAATATSPASDGTKKAMPIALPPIFIALLEKIPPKLRIIVVGAVVIILGLVVGLLIAFHHGAAAKMAPQGAIGAAKMPAGGKVVALTGTTKAAVPTTAMPSKAGAPVKHHHHDEAVRQYVPSAPAISVITKAELPAFKRAIPATCGVHGEKVSKWAFHGGFLLCSVAMSDGMGTYILERDPKGFTYLGGLGDSPSIDGLVELGVPQEDASYLLNHLKKI